MHDSSEMLAAESEAAAQGQYERSMQLLDEIHRRWHDHAMIHARIHWRGGLRFFSQAQYAKGLWEWFAMLFAVPVSWVQRYLGLARKNI